MLLDIYWPMSIVFFFFVVVFCLFFMGVSVSKGLSFNNFENDRGQFGFPNCKDKTLYSLDLASYC